MLRSARTTPDRLLLSTVIVVLAGVVAGTLGLQGLSARSAALDQARAETAYQVRLQIVRTKLVIADTAAGDDVLRGGDQQRIAAREFDHALQPAVTGIVIAGRQPDHADALAVANRWVARYAMQIDNARTLARLGRPGAGDSLRQASEMLRGQVLPRLLAAQNASQARLADDESAATRGPIIALLGLLLALLALAGTHGWLTLRTRRIINPGLAAGLVMVFVVTLASIVLVATSQHRASEVQSGPRRVAQAVVQARIAAFDARAGEAGAVASDRVPDSETAWQASMTSARAALGQAADGSTVSVRTDLQAATKLLQTYATVHAEMLEQARTGHASTVVATAISPTVDGSVGSFEDFDAASGALLARQVQAADDGWAAAGEHLRLIGWLCLIAGLAASAVGWWGLFVRGREYR